MRYFDVKISEQGTKEMLEWAKGNLTPELLDQFAERLDALFVFSGLIGGLIEASDARVFKLVLEKGAGLIFGD